MSPQRNTPSPALDSDIVEPDSGARRRPPRRARAGLRAETRVPYFTDFRAEKLVPLDTKVLNIFWLKCNIGCSRNLTAHRGEGHDARRGVRG